MPDLIEQPDDIDRLFARLERVPAPPRLAERVRERTHPGTALAWPWLLVSTAAMAVLVVTGYVAGARLAATDGLDLVEALLGDSTLLTTAPGDVLPALGEVIPWLMIVVAALSGSVLVWAAGRVRLRIPAPREA
jgi:hypothetical protein